MEDLISRQAVIDAIVGQTVFDSRDDIVREAMSELYDSRINGILSAIDAINEVPSAECPLKEIVKCEDCRYCNEQGGHANCNGYLYCIKWKTLVDDGCFCSWGKRGEP